VVEEVFTPGAAGVPAGESSASQRQRLDRGAPPSHDWTKSYERFSRFEDAEEVAQKLKEEEDKAEARANRPNMGCRYARAEWS
jgi:hypothetical protein